jgi:hypothetical protein
MGNGAFAEGRTCFAMLSTFAFRRLVLQWQNNPTCPTRATAGLSLLARAATLRTTERRAELDGRARARRGLRKPRAGLTVTLQLSPLLSSHTHLDGLLFPVWPHVDMSHARYIAR